LPPYEINRDLKGNQKEKGLEKVDCEKAVSEEADAKAYDDGGQRHASSMEANGIAGGSHGFSASGEAIAVQQALSGGAYEVGELKKGWRRSGVIEEPDRSEACDD
jgi:hypothetical protein